MCASVLQDNALLQHHSQRDEIEEEGRLLAVQPILLALRAVVPARGSCRMHLCLLKPAILLVDAAPTAFLHRLASLDDGGKDF